MANAAHNQPEKPSGSPSSSTAKNGKASESTPAPDERYRARRGCGQERP